MSLYRYCYPSFILFLFLTFVLWSCTPDPPPEPTTPPTTPPVVVPPVTPPVTPPTVNINGKFYIFSGGNMKKLNPQTSTFDWDVTAFNIFASAGSPLNFDADLLYHGNYTGLTAYNATSGAKKWNYNWAAFDNAGTYRATAFNDSLVFFTSPTSAWASASLYCLRKLTGELKWSKPIDAGGWAFYNFNGIPVVDGNNVYTIVRDNNGHKMIRSFDVNTGQQGWSTPWNDNLQSIIQLHEGRLYGFSKLNVTCYDPTNGILLWQTALQATVYTSSFTFFDQSKLIVARNYNEVDNTVQVINLQSGAVTNTFTNHVQADFYNGFFYRNNSLFSCSITGDSLTIASYDMSNFSEKWKYKYGPCALTLSISPVITPDYIIASVNALTSNGNNSEDSRFLVIDASGKLVKMIPYAAFGTSTFIYVDNGVVYKRKDF